MQRSKRNSLIALSIALVGGLTIVIALARHKVDRSRPSETPNTSIDMSSQPAGSPVVKPMNFAVALAWIQKTLKDRSAPLAIVNLWATWCEPCRREMPELVKFVRSNETPLFLISADNTGDIQVVQAFLREHGVDFESALIDGAQEAFIAKWHDQTKALSSPWSMTLPATFAITPDGSVVALLAAETDQAGLKHFATTALARIRQGTMKQEREAKQTPALNQ